MTVLKLQDPLYPEAMGAVGCESPRTEHSRTVLEHSRTVLELYEPLYPEAMGALGCEYSRTEP